MGQGRTDSASWFKPCRQHSSMVATKDDHRSERALPRESMSQPRCNAAPSPVTQGYLRPTPPIVADKRVSRRTTQVQGRRPGRLDTPGRWSFPPANLHPVMCRRSCWLTLPEEPPRNTVCECKLRTERDSAALRHDNTAHMTGVPSPHTFTGGNAHIVQTISPKHTQQGMHQSHSAIHKTIHPVVWK